MTTTNNTNDIDSISLEFNNKFNNSRFVSSYKKDTQVKTNKILNSFDSLYP